MFLLAVGVLAFAQTLTVSAPADITGDAAAHAVGTGQVRWVLFITPSTNSAAVRVGDSSVSTTRGAPIAAGGGLFFPPIPPDGRDASSQKMYSLAQIYYVAQTNDKVSISWGN